MERSASARSVGGSRGGDAPPSASRSGSQVILDLQQYSGVDVKRALSSDRPLLDALKITAFPSVYLLHPNGTHSQLHV